MLFSMMVIEITPTTIKMTTTVKMKEMTKLATKTMAT